MTDDNPLGPTQAASEPAAAGAGVRVSARGYRFGDVIGRGGMGEVLVAHDERIDRDVALKRMREASPSASAVARFLREAKIQARLDHPAIVPVHELGEDDQQRPYFTMKRVTGVTLATLLGDASATPQRLLRAFVDVCLAIARAHALGIVHRDLKPSNVMLGDFGEVYVLDWGVARVLGEPDADAGAIVGTPGYMAPEQARGDEVGPASDVYALGCMLAEVLARFAEPPPEPDAACAEAMRKDPAARPSARALADRVQAYLDGDRDHERRRALAAEHLARARTALAADDRPSAIYLAGRAVALDPDSDASAALLRELIDHVPRVPPHDLRDRLDALDRRLDRAQAASAQRAYLAFYAVAPLFVWQGIIDTAAFIALYCAVTLFVVLRAVMTRVPRVGPVLPLVLGAVVVGLLARVTSPFLIAPTIVATQGAAFAGNPRLIDRWWLPQLVLSLGILVPLVLEQLGMIPPTLLVHGDELVMRSTVIDLSRGAIALLVIGTLATLLAGGSLNRHIARERREAQRSLEIRAFHLDLLVRR